MPELNKEVKALDCSEGGSEEEANLPILYPEETFSIEEVTPEQAKEYLSFSATNRNLTAREVNKLSKEMKAGRWIASSDSLKFDIYGRNCDGQHRLKAVIQSGLTQTFAIRRGLSEEAMAVIDIGRSRTALDTAKIRGIQHIKLPHTSCTNALSLPITNSVGSKVLISETFEKYEKGIRFVVDRKKSPGASHVLCPIAALVTKAFYYENHQKLERFLEVLTTGFCVDESEWAAIALHRSIKSDSDLNLSVKYRTRLYLKAQNALKMFLKGQKIQSIKTTTVTRDDYPIPDFCREDDLPKAKRAFDYYHN